MHPVRLVAAVVLFIVGLVWLAQGIGLIGGSAMTGSAFWGVVGIVLIAAGAWLAWRGYRRTPAEHS